MEIHPGLMRLPEIDVNSLHSLIFRTFGSLCRLVKLKFQMRNDLVRNWEKPSNKTSIRWLLEETNQKWTRERTLVSVALYQKSHEFPPLPLPCVELRTEPCSVVTGGSAYKNIMISRSNPPQVPLKMVRHGQHLWLLIMLLPRKYSNYAAECVKTSFSMIQIKFEKFYIIWSMTWSKLVEIRLPITIVDKTKNNLKWNEKTKAAKNNCWLVNEPPTNTWETAFNDGLFRRSLCTSFSASFFVFLRFLIWSSFSSFNSCF